METVKHIDEKVAIRDLEVSAYRIPTDSPESDGTLRWDSTTMVLVTIDGGNKTGIGYTYAHQSAAIIINTVLKDLINGMDCLDILSIRRAMLRNIRNQGKTGLAYMALSAVDCALCDLKAKVLKLPLIELIGQQRDGMPVYGSGAFTSYTVKKLQKQLAGWVDDGITQVKMKVGREPDKDLKRVEAARKAIGEDPKLFVDVNGAYDTVQAINKAHLFAEQGVSWVEEPVPSNNLDGLHIVKEEVPESIEVAAGEYGNNFFNFKNMLDAKAVDVLQGDITRCGGVTGFLNVASICEKYQVHLSAHCAPALHLHVGPCVSNFRHAEYFYDHVRIENMLFDGVQTPEYGIVYPDLSRPGF